MFRSLYGLLFRAGRRRLRLALVSCSTLMVLALTGFAPAAASAQGADLLGGLGGLGLGGLGGGGSQNSQGTMAEQISEVATGPLVNYKAANDVGTSAYRQNAQLGAFYRDLACSNGKGSSAVNQVKSSYMNFFAKNPNLAGKAVPGIHGGILGSLGLGNLGSGGLSSLGATGVSGLGATGVSDLGATGVSDLGATGISGLGDLGATGVSGLSSLGATGVSDLGATGVSGTNSGEFTKTNSLGFKFTMAGCQLETERDCEVQASSVPQAPTVQQATAVRPVTGTLPTTVAAAQPAAAVPPSTTTAQPVTAAAPVGVTSIPTAQPVTAAGTTVAPETTYAQPVSTPTQTTASTMPPSLAKLYKGPCGIALVKTGTFSPTDPGAVRQALRDACLTINTAKGETEPIPNCTPKGEDATSSGTTTPVTTASRSPLQTAGSPSASRSSSNPLQGLQGIFSRFV